MNYTFFLELGLILLFVRFFYLLTEKIHIPKVLGSLIAGIVLGPAIFNIIQPSNTITLLSKIAIVFLMFSIGMETRLKSFISSTKKFLLIAVTVVAFPLILGFLFSRLYTASFVENFIFGAIITTSSVSITLDSLMELKKMKTSVGMAILGAGVIDDIIGIIFLTLIINNSSITIGMFSVVLAKIFLFFLVAIAFGFVVHLIFTLLETLLKSDSISAYALAYALIMAYIAESFGLSAIIGAYIAGLVIGTTDSAKKTKKQLDNLVGLFFMPIFSASMGLKLQSLNFSISTWIFIFGFISITIGSKIIGNGIGAKICGYRKNDALRIGIGMSARGEMALVMLEAALELSLIQKESFSIILVTIVIVNLISPILFHMSFENKKDIEEKQSLA